MGAWENATTAMFRSLLMRSSEPVQERRERRVGLARRAEVEDVLVVALPLAIGLPHRLDAHAHAHVLGLALLDEREDRDVGAVEGHRGGDVGQLDVPPDHRDAYDAEGGHHAAVRDLDQVLGGCEALGRGDERRHEDLAGLGALRTQDLLVLQRPQVARAVVARDVVVREADVRLHILDRLLRRLAHRVTRKHSRSRMVPVRSAAHTASTRAPTWSRSRSSLTTCASAVSAPSSLTSTKAKGAVKGWRPAIGSRTIATAVTTPVGFTSTHSPPAEPAASEQPSGGTAT